MNKQIIISTSQPFLYQLLSSTLPEGAKITSKAPVERRGLEAINIDINITIDLTKITALALATWLFKSLRRGNRTIDADINRKQIPVDQSESIEFIKKEIESE